MSTVAPEKTEFGKKALGLWSSEGFAPVGGRQLDDVTFAPEGQQREHVTQVGPGLEVVHTAAGDEGDDGGVPFGAIVSRTEQPIFATDSFVAQFELRGVV